MAAVSDSEHLENEESGGAVASQQAENLRQRNQNFSLQTKVSAVLFSSARPISAKRIGSVLEREVGSIDRALLALTDIYDDEIHGFSLKEIAGKWQFRTAPELSTVIRRLHPPKGRRLSRAAAETLSVVAYKQPVHRGDIESVRGVDALPTLKTLLESKLIRVVGKEDSIGNPVLYGTTAQFLEKFGLKDLSELPSPSDLDRLEDEPGESFPEDDEDVSSFEEGGDDMTEEPEIEELLGNE